jgi:protein-S-isoprenylcysteine O-methyltransferase Ste14
MGALTLALFLVYAALAVGLRTAVQLRRTGSTGFKALSTRPSAAELIGGVLFVGGVACAVAAPVLDLTGRLEPLGFLDHDLLRAAGGGIFASGLLTTVWAQFALGDSWRIGVDPEERTELVTGGPFSSIRNPIFTGMMLAFLGLALMLPNRTQLAAFVLLLIGLEIQVRVVEEPYLLRTHGHRYRDYAARAGRFVPRIGRL